MTDKVVNAGALPSGTPLKLVCVDDAGQIVVIDASVLLGKLDKAGGTLTGLLAGPSASFSQVSTRGLSVATESSIQNEIYASGQESGLLFRSQDGQHLGWGLRAYMQGGSAKMDLGEPTIPLAIRPPVTGTDMTLLGLIDLTAGGGPNYTRAKLAKKPSDPNFQLWVSDGDSGAQNTIAASIEHVYVGAGASSAIRFYRGGGAVDGAIVIEASGAEILRVNAGGVSASGNIAHASDNAYSFGTASARASTVFSANGVQTTSDARYKTQIGPLSAAELAVGRRLAGLICKFKMLDAVGRKGDAARLHVGIIAQEVIAAFAAEGLDAFEHGAVCHDAWEASYEEREDAAGEIVRPVQRQATRPVPQPYSEIQIIDGVPTRVQGERTVDEPVFEQCAVVDEAGNAVMVQVAAVLGEDGEEISPAHDEPLMHPVPVMEMVETRYTRVCTREAGEMLSVRENEIIWLVIAAMGTGAA